MFYGLPGPYNPFPSHRYLDYIFDFFEIQPKLIPTHNRKVRMLPKSRKLLVSWAVVAKCLHFSETVAEQEIVLQSQGQKKGNYLIKYAKTLYAQQPRWLQREFPLSKRLEDFPMDELEFKNGSRLIGIPEGADAARSYHPSIHVMDEAAFQPEGADAYDVALAGAQFVIVVSSAYPGWFQTLAGEDRLPRSAKQLSKGVYFTENPKALPVMWVHYTAHPDRDKQWEKDEKANYQSDAAWKREQEIDFTALGGERVLGERLEARWDDIVISDSDWRPHSTWLYDAGLDYGKTHMTAFEVFATDFDGVDYAVMEHYQNGLTPQQHAEVIRGLHLPCAGQPNARDRISATWSDPALFPESISGGSDSKFSSYQDLFEKHGSIKMQKGLRGLDLKFVDLLLDLWPADPSKPVRFKIWCPIPVTRKTPGTYTHGCPNLLWEILNLRRRDASAQVQEKSGPPESLVDKDNDAWDAAKYRFTSRQIELPKHDPEQEWERTKERILLRNPHADLNNLYWARQQWEDRRAEAERVPTYR